MAIIAGLAVACAVSLLATPAVGALARRHGFIAKPTGDRWHRRPTALLGGIAVFAATAAGAALAGGVTGPLAVLAVAAAGMFAVGLVDDLVRLRPATKLTLQIAAASLAVWGGIRLDWTGSLTLDSILTLFWLIGVTNAFNLVDNMDGACAGLGAIAGGTLAALGAMAGAGGHPATAWAAALAGALLGFLVYNFHPASIFLGDSGSLFIGFLLGGLVAATEAGQRVPFSFVLLPLLVLAVPIFDTTLVTLARKLSGRPASQGGTDHTAHRLVALGFSEVRAVVFLYVLAGLAGLGALTLNQERSGWELLVIGLGLGLLLLALALLRVRAYGGRDYSVVLEGPMRAQVAGFLLRHHIFELLLDLLLVAAAYYTAYRIRFDPARFRIFFPTFLDTLPIVVACQIVSLRLSGAYGFIWRYFGMADLAPLLRGVLAGTAASILLLTYLYRFENLSRSVFLIYAVLLTALLVTSHAAFRLLPQFAGAPGGSGRCLIYGAGDAGDMLVRELANNSSYGYQPIGFLDDDPRKVGRRIRGVRVLGPRSALAAVLASRGADAVIVSSERVAPGVVAELREECRAAGVPVLRFACQLMEVPDGAPEATAPDPVTPTAG